VRRSVAEYEEVRALLEPLVTADPKDYELMYVPRRNLHV
jgi:hypothetical protein